MPSKEELGYKSFSLDPPGNDIKSEVPFEHKSFKLKSSFRPVGSFQLESMFCSIEQDLHRQKYRAYKEKPYKKRTQSSKVFENNKDIVIKPADKGSAIVILDELSYINEGQKQLNKTQFYEATDSDLIGEVVHRINLHVHNMLQKCEISQNICNYLTTDIDRTQQIYLLPKIYKDPYNPPGRPIVSGSGGPTEKLSQFVDHFIGHLVPLSQSYIRDSTHLINILNELPYNQGCYYAP